MPTSASPASRRKRVRLKPEVRSRLILDAARAEFGTRGFTATRIEDIAARAGLTKTGVYAHFAGKDAIFEALLTDALQQVNAGRAAIWRLDGSATAADMVDAYLDGLYQMVQDPVFTELFRLLVTESQRVPELIRHWHAQVVLRYRFVEQDLINECVRRGLLRDSPLTRLFSLSVAPAFLWLVSKMILRQDAEYPLDQVRQIHRAMLLDQLQPR
ncbi:TetR/AcrR family transcriptional regulator [Dokdonella sp.]|uniref:TetR/AcrR family transcriptional regulator n=1 Tax=Dokdonella sp. TaxID=2291710 RepID=UPI0025C50080|nr:TetR/AcrR family transcriptional regulator [Dokdonella sp.]MBX3687865.1 TetR/AcrR family transcriptional regulator [Dokdonella sp.]